MFHKIMMPIDLAHADRLEKARAAAAGLAKTHDIPVIYAGVTGTAPGTAGHNPAEYAQRLAEFASAEGARHGIVTEAHPRAIADPAADLDRALMTAVEETGADLVVMASHHPTLADHVWPSHGGRLAAHARVSVFIVRD